MLIGLNGDRLLIEHPAGIEKYAFNLYKALAQLDKINNYILYLRQTPPENFISDLFQGNKNFSYKVLTRKISWTQNSLASELIKNPVDVFFSPFHTMPVVRHIKTKFVSMIHGLEYTHSAEHKNILKRPFLAGPFWFVSAFSDAIIVPSLQTKHRLENKSWPLFKTTKVYLVHEGVTSEFYTKNVEKIAEIKEKYKLEDYLIFVSTIQPRKNLPNTIEAFSKLIQTYPKFVNLKLAIVGKKGWLFQESIEAPAKYHIPNNVVFLGRVSDKELPSLIQGSKGLVNFSFEEGFGLPLVEAMASGIPCAVSNIEAFKEVGDKNLEYANPFNVNEITNVMHTILSEPAKTDDLINRAKLFTWEKAAEETLNIFMKVTSSSKSAK